jgi:hypothetical protein
VEAGVRDVAKRESAGGVEVIGGHGFPCGILNGILDLVWLFEYC